MLSSTTILSDFSENDTIRNWCVYLDGNKIFVKKRLSIVHPDLGSLNYAKSSLGFDTIAFEEKGNGGSVIVPYFIYEKELFVGFVEQDRPNQMHMDGTYLTYNLPRGKTQNDESFVKAALREAGEEMKLDMRNSKFSVKKLSAPLNNDSAFFTYIPSEKKGVEFFSLHIPFDYLEEHRHNVYKIKSNYIDNNKESDDKIYSCLFFHWTKVFDLNDMLSVTGVLLLRLSLEHK